jgi:hypothetical protein
VFRQNLAWEWFNFAEGDGFKPACAFQPKAEAAYAGEKIEDA